MPFEGMNFGLATPTVKLETPQESMAKAMQFQALQQQTEAGKIDLQQKRQAQDDVARIRQLGTETGGDAEKFIEALTRNGFHQQAQAVRKDYDDKKLKAVEIAEKIQKLDAGRVAASTAAATAAGVVAKTAKTPEDWFGGLTKVAQDHPVTGGIQRNPDGSVTLPPMFAPYAEFNPANVKTVGDHALTFTMASDIDKENRKRAEFTGATGGVVGGKPVLVAHNAEGVAKVLTVDGKPVGHIPAAAITVNAQNANPTGPGAANQFAPDPLRPWRDHPSFKDVLSKNGTLATDLDAALNNDYKFGGARNVQQDRAVERAARAINPNWRQGNYEAKQKMLVDPQVIAANAAIMHATDFMGDYARLSPQASSKLWNTPVNEWKKLAQGNSEDAKILATLETTAMSFAGEYGKAIGGSDAIMAEHERQKLFNPNRPFGQLSGATGAVGTLLKRTINAKENITRRSDPNSMPLTLLDDQTIGGLKSLGVDYSPGGVKGKGLSPAQLPKLSVEEAAKLKPGERFLDMNGKERVKN